MKTNTIISAGLLAWTLFSVNSLPAQTVSETYISNWNNPEIEERIDRGIETHRKDWAEIRLVNQKGEEIQFTGKISIQQKSHDFLFGASIFMLDEYEDPKQNETYQQVFKDLLNFATVPLYWKTLEPEKGRLRYRKESSHIFRRPPPDRVVEFCNNHDVAMKGHPLFWDNPGFAIPAWWPSEEDSMTMLLEQRIRGISDRYGQDIQYWDVVNETNNRHVEVPAPRDFPLLTFELADKYLGKSHSLAYNFTTRIWSNYAEEYSLEYLLIENLLLKGGRVDAIGLQFHLMGKGIWNGVLQGRSFTPQELYRALDLYGRFGLPLQITEVTFPALPEGKTGQQNQAQITRDFYRLWFSHPNVEAITWWNVADGGAAKRQNRWRGGFLDENLDPKPAYHVLNELINEEWTTDLEKSLQEQSSFRFKGFHGTYEVVLSRQDEILHKQTIHLDAGGQNHFIIPMP